MDDREFDRLLAARLGEYEDQVRVGAQPAVAAEPRAHGQRFAAVAAAFAVVAAGAAVGLLATATVFAPRGPNVAALPSGVLPSVSLAASPSPWVTHDAATATPEPSPSAAPPTHAPVTPAPPTGEPGFDSLGWFRLDSTPAGDTVAWQLRVGLLSGETTFQVDIPPQAALGEDLCCAPFVAGPYGGRIAYTLQRDGGTDIHVVTATDGADTVVASDPGLVAAVALDPTGRTVYYLRIDAVSRTASVWRVSSDGGVAPEPVIDETTAQAPRALLAARASRWVRLLVSSDGAFVAAVDCAQACSLLVADTRTGAVRRLGPMDFEEGTGVIGMTDRALVFVPSCPDATCDAFTIDVQSDARTQLASMFPWPTPVLERGERGPTYLYESGDAGAGRMEVTALDLATGAERVVYRAEPYDPLMRSMRLTPTHDYSHGVDLPPGWFLVWPGVNAAPGPEELEPPLAVRAADGTVVELPALGG